MTDLKQQRVRIGSKNYKIFSDDDYLKHISSDFEPHMCALFESLIKKEDRIFDIGANIGCTSLLFAGISAQVDSFEPSPTTFQILRKNIQLSSYQNIKLHNYGLGAKNENLTLTFSPSNRSGAFVSDITQATIGHSIESIEIKKGDDFFSEILVNFIKIDVEGYEKNVIEGLKECIKNNEPIVVLELNHWCLNAFQRISIPDFFDFLTEIFPILYAVEGNTFLDLHDPSDRYIVMYHHIIHFKYANLVATFDKTKLTTFLEKFEHSS